MKKQLVKFRVHLHPLNNLMLKELQVVINEGKDVIYYPSLSSFSGFGRITSFIKETGKVLYRHEDFTKELSPRYLSILTLISGYDYCTGKQTKTFIYLDESYFSSREDYVFFVKEQAYKKREQFSAGMHVEFELDTTQNLPTSTGMDQIKYRIMDLVSKRRKFRENDSQKNR